MTMLAPIADDLWSLDFDQVLPGRFRMPARATIARLSVGVLWIHSPVPISDEAAREIDALGSVRFLVAPNRLHHMYLRAAAARYPDAEIVVAPGLSPKVANLPHRTLDEVKWEGLLTIPIEGAPSVDEHVFFHEASGTLIVTDLLFNVTSPRGFMANVTLWIVGAHGRLAQSRAWRWFVRDRERAAASAARVVELPAQRIVPAHGAVADGPGLIRPALAWMLKH